MMKSERSQTSKGNFWKSDFPRSLTSNVLLAPYTTFHIGGPARFFVLAKSVEEVAAALACAQEHTLPVFVLGGGSNVVVADDGFHGLVLCIGIPGISFIKKDDRVLVTAGAGVVWDELVAWTIEHGFSGLECMSGVPGTVGGAVVANLGCYGAQCSDTFVHAEVFDTHASEGGLALLEKEKCEFSYHDSLFGRAQGRYIVVRAAFSLSTDPAAQPSYKDNRFDMAALTKQIGRTPTQQDVRDAILNVREQKGNLIMKGRLSYKGAGSFFHMPFVSPQKLEEIRQRAQSRDAQKEERLRPWAWKQADGTYKIAPGFLLEYTEFQKGYRRGRVGVSPRHTLAIINIEQGSARDVAELARDMQGAVHDIFGVTLEREVEYIGAVEK